MSDKTETSGVTREEFLTELRMWAKANMIAFLLGEDTSEFTDDVRTVVDIVSKVRKAHDEAAKDQGNETVRAIRSDSGKTETLTEEQRKAKALAKAEELIG